ncbi:MAG TPA: DUF1501 domain-containing protein [Blastocatellia bacterium]|nr:DUF1501 domain-containing protein [Blastocatellia bacterium]
MPTTRRQFIKRSAGAVTVGLVMPGTLLREARAQQAQANTNRKFVVIQLAGGNDGLNTLVPYTDSRYYSLRPQLAFNEAELKDAEGRSTIISNDFGLHPALGKIKQLYDQGRVAIVLGVGYQDSTLSHFLSMDIWHTADTSGLASKGWLGRYADIALLGQTGLPAAALGGLEKPKSFNAGQVVVPNILNFEIYNFLADPAYPNDYANQINAFNFGASRVFDNASLLSTINNAAFESVRGAQHVQRNVNNYRSSIVYPRENPLAVGLQMVAQLLVTIPEAHLLYVQLGGFDHHADQVDHPNGQPNKLAGQHNLLLRWFSDAVDLFYKDMAEHGLADDVILMEWSEFGRRPQENASFGTDHGTSSQMFIIGNAVRGGLYGRQPSLAATELDLAGNPKFHVDFREVYATILDGWLGADSKAVLGAGYQNVGFLG